MSNPRLRYNLFEKEHNEHIHSWDAPEGLMIHSVVRWQNRYFIFHDFSSGEFELEYREATVLDLPE